MSKIFAYVTHQVQQDYYTSEMPVQHFNYLYARHHGGTFIIHIEDTDRKRHVEDGERSQLENLRWLGMDWDESQKHMKITASLSD